MDNQDTPATWGDTVAVLIIWAWLAFVLVAGYGYPQLLDIPQQQEEGDRGR